VPRRILVVGSGGREHALVRQLARSPLRPELYAVPGNPGTAADASNILLDPQDQPALVQCCRERRIELAVIGPEDPLIAGLGDALQGAGVAVFGPGAAGARLEGDKEFAKEVMAAAGVPTASYRSFVHREAAVTHLDRVAFPVVVKACGAAAGKGVAVCSDRAAALAHVDRCLTDRQFGEAGDRLLIEECLSGPELSVLAVTDGEAHVLLAPSRDHKRVGEGERGPNTGGMGAFAPVALDAEITARIDREIIIPTLAELRSRGILYRGVLYAGLMLTAEGPKVLEFNCRFGDPETQVVLPLLAGDLVKLLEAAATGRLGRLLENLPPPPRQAPPQWSGAALSDWDRHAVVVVGAARGYPGSYAKGAPLELPPERDGEAWIIHAGTQRDAGGLRTAGGRVLGAVGSGPSLSAARRAAYELLAAVKCDDLFWRRDIAGLDCIAEGESR
jgi:phosphoribosylamine--glycine ligase